MNQIIVSPQVFVKDSKAVTTSLEVAKVFKKRHDHVLRDIESLEIPEDFRLLNFGESDYLNSQGKIQPMYEMTRDGFTLLAMGFTGKKAMQFKIAYIQAFNAMENQLKTVAWQLKAGELLTPEYKKLLFDLEYLKLHPDNGQSMESVANPDLY